MSALDSSVVIAAVADWHAAHERTRPAAHDQFVAAHAYLESFAVLTRLPMPRRLDARTAAALLESWFPPQKVLVPASGSAARYVEQMAAAGVLGGSAYDALVALTAAEHDEILLTRDRRAEVTYRRLGVAYRLLD